MKELGWVDNNPTNISDHNGITSELSENGTVLLEMALIELDNWLGKRLPKADQTTKELKEE
eukprot:12430226-Heterocapsa_arctica.AAC.1